MGYYIILYNILLLFGGLFVSGGLRPLPKWPIASAGSAWELWGFGIKWGNEESFWVWFFVWQRGKVKEEGGGGKDI